MNKYMILYIISMIFFISNNEFKLIVIDNIYLNYVLLITNSIFLVSFAISVFNIVFQMKHYFPSDYKLSDIYMFIISFDVFIMYVIKLIIMFDVNLNQFDIIYNSILILISLMIINYVICPEFFNSCIESNHDVMKPLDVCSLITLQSLAKKDKIILFEQIISYIFNSIIILITFTLLTASNEGLNNLQIFGIVFRVTYSIFSLRLLHEVKNNVYRYITIMMTANMFTLISYIFDVILFVNFCLNKDGNYYQYVTSIFNMIILNICTIYLILKALVNWLCCSRSNYEQIV